MPSVRIPIDDGFTLKGRVPGRRGLWDEFEFRYRPATYARIAAYQRDMRDGSAEAQTNATVALLRDQVKEWTARDQTGNILPLSAPVLRELYKPVLDQLVDAVCGYSAAEAEEDEKN
jgi:hypothetical protein